MNKILIKFPSRERPEVFKVALTKYINLADDLSNITFLFALDEDDSHLEEYISIIKDIRCPKGNSILGQSVIDIGLSESKIHAVNRGINEYLYNIRNLKYNYSRFDILLLASDDMWPVTQGYDNAIRDQFKSGTTDLYIWFNDGCQNRINTLSIMGYDYYKRFDYIYHPEYKSFFCDNLQTEVAESLGKCVRVDKTIIRHEHPAWGKGVENDELYDKNKKYWDEDKALYRKHKLIFNELKGKQE